MEMAARLFATSQRELRQMSRSDLARLYRTRAKSFHPDQGGSKAEFIQLTEAYHKLLRTKR
jgi:DnaJ-class molecular chaperone